MIKILTTALILGAVITPGFAQDKPAPAPTPVVAPKPDTNPKVTLLKTEIENIQLKQQLLQASFQNIQNQYKELSTELVSKQAELEVLEPKPVPAPEKK